LAYHEGWNGYRLKTHENIQFVMSSLVFTQTLFAGQFEHDIVGSVIERTQQNNTASEASIIE